MRVFVGLGSNVGDRVLRLQGAVTRLREITSMVAISRVYETAPVGGPEQGPYLNAVICIEWSSGLPALLSLTQAIEIAEARTRTTQWGPRSLDLDLLYAHGEVLNTDALTVPHPRLFERAFALVPLLDVADGDLALRAREALAAISDQNVNKTDYSLT